MTPPDDLVGRLADHATAMANVVSYEDAADTAARALLEFLAMDSVVQVRLTTDGALHVGARHGPLGEALATLDFERLVTMGHLPQTGAVWQRRCTLDDPPDSIERALALTGARSVAITGFNGLGRLRGLIVLASTEPVVLGARDIRLLELLMSLAVSVLRATMLVPTLRRNAAIDPLTGLWHRGAFGEAMLGRRNSDRHALAIVDVDHFKACNDRRGHAEGDRVLQAVAVAMSSVLRSTDSVFRLGGDEFAALMEVDSPAAALDMGRRVHAAIAASGAEVSVSIGIAVGARGEGETQLRDRADAALYRVKANGRDGVEIDRQPPRVGDVGVAA